MRLRQAWAIRRLGATTCRSLRW